MEWYLTCRQISHAADTLNTYCQSILAEVLKSKPEEWNTIKSKLKSKDVASAIDRLSTQSELDNGVRMIFRKILNTIWCNEAEIILVLRNKIVHQAGYDSKNEVIAIIKKYPPGQMFLNPADLNPDEFPVDIDTNCKLVIDAKSGYWASSHVTHLIHLIDQNLCSRFGIPLSLLPFKSNRYTIRAGSNRILPAGHPLPLKISSNRLKKSKFPILTFKEYKTMNNQKEQNCAKTWHRITSEIHSFIKQICEEIGVQTNHMSSGLAGRPQGNTIEGHDRSFNYNLSDPNMEGLKDSNHLGIRLRQKDFEPFITIWSSNTQMKDYNPCELSDKVKEHITTAIQQTISS